MKGCSAVIFFLTGKQQFFLGLGQDRLGLADIFPYLAGQLCRTGKFLFTAQVFQQVYLYLLPVNFLIEIEYMRFSGQAIFSKGRVIADIQNPAVTFAVIDNLGNIHSMFRTEVFLG